MYNEKEKALEDIKDYVKKKKFELKNYKEQILHWEDKEKLYIRETKLQKAAVLE